MATFVDVTGAIYPEKYKGNKILPMEGESLLPAFLGEQTSSRTFCFEHEQHCGVRKGKWKLVKVKEKNWELYDIDKDRAETNNLKDVYPELVKELVEIWEAWAVRIDVFPRMKD